MEKINASLKDEIDRLSEEELNEVLNFVRDRLIFLNPNMRIDISREYDPVFVEGQGTLADIAPEIWMSPTVRYTPVRVNNYRKQHYRHKIMQLIHRPGEKLLVVFDDRKIGSFSIEALTTWMRGRNYHHQLIQLRKYSVINNILVVEGDINDVFDRERPQRETYEINTDDLYDVLVDINVVA